MNPACFPEIDFSVDDVGSVRKSFGLRYTVTGSDTYERSPPEQLTLSVTNRYLPLVPAL